jgi:signal transduction histidine kinase
MTLVKSVQLTWAVEEAVRAVSALADHPEAARFVFDRDSFMQAAPHVWTDEQLFQAALGNILDNARKYSFDATIVHIAARRSQERSLQIEVANKGIALPADDLERCRERGWRSETALRHTDKGLGVGLWLTDRILRTIDAQLLIAPTDAAGITRFTISLPIDPPRREG